MGTWYAVLAYGAWGKRLGPALPGRAVSRDLGAVRTRARALRASDVADVWIATYPTRAAARAASVSDDAPRVPIAGDVDGPFG